MPITSVRRGGERGFGLFEVTLVLAAAVLVTAALTPAVLRALQAAREDAARDELRLLHEAMLGSDAERTYGFIGDMGRLPQSVDELVDGAGLPLFAATDPAGVGYGWNGPYVNRGTDDASGLLDPWGVAYDVGVVGAGQLRSAGPNALRDDADDIVYPPAPVVPWSTLIVAVKGHSGELVDNDPEGCVVTLAYSDNGSYATVTDDEAPFSFADTHRGLHTVQATCPRLDGAGSATESAIARVTGAEQQLVELHVELGEAAEDDSPEPDTDSAETESAGAVSAGTVQR